MRASKAVKVSMSNGADPETNRRTLAHEARVKPGSASSRV